MLSALRMCGGWRSDACDEIAGRACDAIVNKDEAWTRTDGDWRASIIRLSLFVFACCFYVLFESYV